MKKLFISLTFLSASCINDFEEIYISENTSLVTDVPRLAELASQVRFSGFSTYTIFRNGTQQHGIFVSSSYSPFACSGDLYNHTNHVGLSLVTAQEPAVGDILPIEEFNGRLSTVDDEDFLSLYADVHTTASPDLEGTFEITEISGNSLSGVITAHLSGDSVSAYSSDQDFSPEEITFTLNITSAPSCNPFSVYY
jgi:hypothetical protein